jgi:leader peptidase (prepilin peptidase) / N-methyltransferase
MIGFPMTVALAGVVAAAVIDARTGLIPNAVSVPTTLVALAAAAAGGAERTACCGIAAAGGALWLLHAMTRGKGLGLGDVKLAAAIGAGFGPFAGLEALGAAFVTGAAFAAWQLANRRATLRSEIRFGPFLAAGSAVVAVVSGAAS